MSHQAHEMVYGIRAATLGQAEQHRHVRHEVVRYLDADPRTADLYEQWAILYGFEPLMHSFAVILDAVQFQLDATCRHEALQRIHETPAAPQIARLQDQLAALHRSSQPARVREMERFIGTTLYPQPPSFVGWLTVDLLDRFDNRLGSWARRSESDPFAARKVIHLGA